MPETSGPKAKPNRSWLYLALGFTLLWGIYVTRFSPLSGRLAGPRLEPSGTGASADYSWKLLDLNDGPFEFSRFKGKTVFLNIWATWCGPCVMEIPSIEKLAATPGLKDVAFVCVSTDESAATGLAASITLAPVTAELVAAAICGEPVPAYAAAFRPGRGTERASALAKPLA